MVFVGRILQSCVLALCLALSTHAMVGNQPVATTTNNDNITLTAHIATFTQTVIETISQLNYYSACKLTVQFPATDYAIAIDWGFGGSEDIFAPLPTIPVKFIPLNNQSAQKHIDLKELGTALLHDQMQHSVKQIPILSFLFEQQLNPFKVFCIKTFLLTKDLYQGRIDTHDVKIELARLLIKLSLSADLDGLEEKALTTYLPTFVNSAITPSIRTYIDKVWTMLTDKNKSLDLENIEQRLTRVVYACSFRTEAGAQACLELCKEQKPAHFINGTDIKKFSHFSATQAPEGMPVQLAQAATSSPLDQYITVKTDTAYWVGYTAKDQTLNLYESLELLSIIALCTLKEYIAMHHSFLLANPQEAAKYHNLLEENNKKARRIKDFLVTESGKASIDRLQKQIDAIGKEQLHFINTTPEAALLIQRARDLESKIVTYQKMHAGSTGFAKQNLEWTLNNLTNQRKALNDLMQSKGILVQSESTAPTPGNITTIENQLNRLKNLEQELKNRGETVPQDITNLINEYETKLVAYRANKATNEHDKEKALALQKRDHLVQVYHNEVQTLQKELDHVYGSINKITDPIERQAETLIFTTSQQPMYQAYMKRLENTIEQLKHTEDYTTLIGQPETLAAFLSDTNFYAHEINEFVDNINGTSQQYAHLRQRLFAALGLLVKHSATLKDFSHVMRIVVARYLPAFSDEFDQLIQTGLH